MSNITAVLQPKQSGTDQFFNGTEFTANNFHHLVDSGWSQTPEQESDELTDNVGT